MKMLMIMVLCLWTSVVLAQTNEQESAKKPDQIRTVQEANEAAAESGKERGISISSAARRSTLMKERANSNASRGNAEIGKDNPSNRGNNGNRGNSGNANRPANAGKPELPAQARPSVNVPQSRPNAPVVRPNRPAPNRPNTPPRRPNTPPNRPNNPPGNPGGG